MRPPPDLIRHLVAAARLVIDPHVPGFSGRFPSPQDAREMAREAYVETHNAYIESKLAEPGKSTGSQDLQDPEMGSGQWTHDDE